MQTSPGLATLLDWHERMCLIRFFEEIAIDSVVLQGGKGQQNRGSGCRTGAIEIQSSRYVTIRGLAVTHFYGPAVRLRGGSKDSEHIHIERNRLFSKWRRGMWRRDRRRA